MSYEPGIGDIVETWARETFKYVEFSFQGQMHVKVRKTIPGKDGGTRLVRTVMICPRAYASRPEDQDENKIVFRVNNHGYYGHGPSRNFHVMAEFDIRDPECFSKMFKELKMLGINLK
jgi:hypothetical protein